MRAAFKEWAIVVDALIRGEQIIILRKGGIREGRGGFTVDYSRFILFPTRYHQQREAVLPAAQARFDALAPHFPDPALVHLDAFAEVVATEKLDSVAMAERLKGQHIWRDEVIADRVEWGREKGIYALAVRVYRLPMTIELPQLREYSGCKSWVELANDIETAGALPALSDNAFNEKLQAFHNALAAVETRSTS